VISYQLSEFIQPLIRNIHTYLSTTNYADKRIIRLGVQALAWQDAKLEFGKIVKRGACY